MFKKVEKLSYIKLSCALHKLPISIQRQEWLKSPHSHTNTYDYERDREREREREHYYKYHTILTVI